MASKAELNSRVKSTGTAFVFMWFLMAHYGYLGKWGIQILFWVTIGGLGVWWIVDLFRLSGMVRKYNIVIYDEIEAMEKKEKQEDLERLMLLKNG